MAGHNLTDVATWTAAVHVPNPGEPVVANDLEVIGQALANRTAYLHAPLIGGRGRAAQTTPRFNATYWNYGEDDTPSVDYNGVLALQSKAGSDSDNVARHVVWDLDVPHGATLAYVNIFVAAATGHGAFPGGAPQFPIGARFQKQHLGTGAVTYGTIVSDGSATAGAYEAYHNIGSMTVNEVIDLGTYRYMVRILNERGTNSIAAGTLIYHVVQNYTPGAYAGGL